MDTKYARNVANEGRGATMTKVLHDACEEIDRLQALNAELVAALDSIKGCADALVGLQPNLAQINKICAIANLARAALSKAKGE